MTKSLATALLLSTLAILMVLYAMQPVGAAVPSPAAATSSADPMVSLDLSMPPPQEPFDTTPITPHESAGAPRYESL